MLLLFRCVVCRESRGVQAKVECLSMILSVSGGVEGESSTFMILTHFRATSVSTNKHENSQKGSTYNHQFLLKKGD